MTSYKIEVVESSPVSVLGEGPHWDIDSQSLYYVDVYNDKQSILRFDYNENKTYGAVVPGHPRIPFIIPADNTKDQFIVASGQKILLIKWDGKSAEATVVKIVGEVGPYVKDFGFNDAKCDASGTLFSGTLPYALSDFEKNLGTFYRYTSKEQFVPLKSKIGCTNGLVWNEKTNKLYYIDSWNWDIKEFDYDPKTKNISNERVVIDFRVNGERPVFVADGMTIDANGSLFVGAFNSSKVLKINPNTGIIEQEIEFPVEQIVSVAFGGPNLDILYVTSASVEVKSPKPAPPAGKLFAVSGLGVKGLPMRNVKLH